MTLAYHATNGRVHLRILAYKPSLSPVPEGCLRVIVQVVENNRPIEEPIHTENLPVLELARVLHLSRNEGWDLQPWEAA